MTVREIIARLREIEAEESAIVGEACALQSWLRARNPEGTSTHASLLLTSLVPTVNSERARLRTLIRKLEEKGEGAVGDETLAGLITPAAERLLGYRASLRHAKQNKNG